jgi:Transposase IS4
MTTGHRIEPKIFRMRKRPKKTASNATITREPFKDKSTKILPIPTFIDDYNHYIGGVDQSNQLRASFTTHFSRNQKEFFPRVFWAIDVAVYNSYKLHLALNGSKTSSTGKRDPRQHREWVEDLVNLLFQVNNDNFGEEITSKPYPKYVYQPVSKGPKLTEKEAFLKAINGVSSDHLYGLNPLDKCGFCFFCEKKSPKSRKSTNSLFQKTF